MNLRAKEIIITGLEYQTKQTNKSDVDHNKWKMQWEIVRALPWRPILKRDNSNTNTETELTTSIFINRQRIFQLCRPWQKINLPHPPPIIAPTSRVTLTLRLATNRIRHRLTLLTIQDNQIAIDIVIYLEHQVVDNKQN